MTAGICETARLPAIYGTSVIAPRRLIGDIAASEAMVPLQR